MRGLPWVQMAPAYLPLERICCTALVILASAPRGGLAAK